MMFKPVERKISFWATLGLYLVVCALGFGAFAGVNYYMITHRCAIIEASGQIINTQNGEGYLTIPQRHNRSIDVVVDVKSNDSTSSENLQIIDRKGWMAKPPASQLAVIFQPVQYIIIMHTATKSCFGRQTCSSKVRSMQEYHMDERHWKDIVYNFLVSGDGLVYEGRGWQVEGGHEHAFNNKSLEIAAIGNFNLETPTMKQLNSIKALIQLGLEMGFIDKDYKLLGAKQVQDTLSPGFLLYENIKAWPHWMESP